jgi:D-alanyl-D-alanine dipeptidase
VQTAGIRLIALAIGLTAFFAVTADHAAEKSAIPMGFVQLRAVDATIVQDIRYATAHNFTQAPVPGYLVGECVVLREVGNALKLVQADLRPRGLSLKVYDCYRPVRAVKAFVAWVKNPKAPTDGRFWPRTSRGDLIKAGYVAANSVHSRGAAIDLTLTALPPAPKSKPKGDSKLDFGAEPKVDYGQCNGAQRELDDSLDMGTTFDCFDPMSNTASDEITPEQHHNRQTLSAAMAHRGFKNYAGEWWHFTFSKLPHLPTALDFAITK